MSIDKPRLSLIVATVGRIDPLLRLFDSLAKQSVHDFEVVVVDQNQGEELATVLAPFAECIDFRRVRSVRGLSRARNVGLRCVRGDIVGFPDDDCWYDMDVVARCLRRFESEPGLDGLAGICRDADGRESSGRYDKVVGLIDRRNVWRRANSTTIFCRTSVALEIGGFDESLGVGSGTRWGSGEETDFLLRAIQRKCRFVFDPTFVVRHPQSGINSISEARRRALPYARGYQRVLATHRYPASFMLMSMVRPLLGAIFRCLRGEFAQAALSFWSGVGRFEEWARDWLLKWSR